MTIQEQISIALGDCVNLMNTYINEQGQIKPSSVIIKTWHTYTNYDWELILCGAKYLNDCRAINLKSFVERDIDLLLNHISEYHSHCDNLLYPSIKTTNSLPSAITHNDLSKYPKTIKTRTFRTMMNIREAICTALDIDLPNEDSSIGRLNPTQYETLFAYE